MCSLHRNILYSLYKEDQVQKGEVTLPKSGRWWSTGMRKVLGKIWPGWFKESSVGSVKRFLNKAEMNLAPVLMPASLLSIQLKYGSFPPIPYIQTHTPISTYSHIQTHTYTLTNSHINPTY